MCTRRPLCFRDIKTQLHNPKQKNTIKLMKQECPKDPLLIGSQFRSSKRHRNIFWKCHYVAVYSLVSRVVFHLGIRQAFCLLSSEETRKYIVWEKNPKFELILKVSEHPVKISKWDTTFACVGLERGCQLVDEWEVQPPPLCL